MYEICNVKLIGFSNTQLRFFSKAAVVKCPAGPSQYTVYVYLYAGMITVPWPPYVKNYAPNLTWDVGGRCRSVAGPVNTRHGLSFVGHLR